jgi:hypothetical protein
MSRPPMSNLRRVAIGFMAGDVKSKTRFYRGVYATADDRFLFVRRDTGTWSVTERHWGGYCYEPQQHADPDWR